MVVSYLSFDQGREATLLKVKGDEWEIDEVLKDNVKHGRIISNMKEDLKEDPRIEVEVLV